MLIQLPRNALTRAGETLAHAFHDDPMWKAVFPDSTSRPDTLAAMFTAVTRATVAARGVAETDPDVAAVALWLPPGKKLGLRAMLRSSLALPRFAMGLSGPDRKRMLSVLGQLEDKKKALMPGRHWYLSAVGVDPDRQGEGLGSALVRSGMAAADQANVPIYLETETEDNADWYRGFGFEVAEQITATGLDLPIWLMIRRPNS